ncbi:MAG TPA: haloalkane dehalogenase [Gaiellaceae bacterium]|nr:haloalkane dehalogenase [Gaiellaceae bacterium]
MDAYRTPDERFAGLPAWPYEPRYAEQDGLRMHYLDEGDGDPVLLLHGEPTWGFLYRKVVPALAAAHRVALPDYFGFGRSDKPLDPGWYSYDSHYRSVERLVCDELDLSGLTVVVHDWGGPIGLRLAVEHEDRVERLVLMSTGVGVGAPSEEWLRFRAMVRRVGTEIVPSRLVRASCATELPDEVAAGYDAPFPVRESKVGVVAFPELVPTEPDHPSAAAMLAVRDGLERWTKPALVLAADSDPIFSLGHGERTAALIPGAGPPETISGAGHMLQEDRGEEIGARIAAWLASR